MAVQLGIFRLNVKRYTAYDITFEDVAGLHEKSEVKIAGVKVGWIEKISLTKDSMTAHVRVQVKNGYQLHDDAYVTIRQEGIIGTKYLEIVPGSPQRPVLTAGACLPRPGESIVSMDNLMQQCRTIADRVTSIAGSIDRAIGSDQQPEKLQTIVNNLSTVSEKLVTISSAVERTLTNNEQAVGAVINNLTIISDDLRTAIPQLKNTLDRLAQQIETGVLPAVQGGLDKIGGVVDKLGSAADNIEKTVKDASSGIQHASSIAQKIDNGTGLLGKLINDDKTYQDLCNVTCSLKDGIEKFNQVGIDVDFHSESMLRPTDCYCHCNNKGYFNMYFRTCPDWFYAIQLVTSEQGWPDRLVSHESYFKKDCTPINPNDIVIDNGAVKVAPNIERMCIKRNNARFDIQIGKIFNHCILRAGTIEHTFGLGLDAVIPLHTDALRWISTLELFDFYGQNRVCGHRVPHLKWLNRLVVLNNLYFVWGIDDFISKSNTSGFFGVGLRFSDDDLKVVASKLGFLGMGS